MREILISALSQTGENLAEIGRRYPEEVETEYERLKELLEGGKLMPHIKGGMKPSDFSKEKLRLWAEQTVGCRHFKE